MDRGVHFQRVKMDRGVHFQRLKMDRGGPFYTGGVHFQRLKMDRGYLFRGVHFQSHTGLHFLASKCALTRVGMHYNYIKPGSIQNQESGWK